MFAQSSRISRQVASTGQTGVKKSRKEQEEDDEEKSVSASQLESIADA